MNCRRVSLMSVMVSAALLVSWSAATADEGMWLFNASADANC